MRTEEEEKLQSMLAIHNAKVMQTFSYKHLFVYLWRSLILFTLIVMEGSANTMLIC